MFNKRGRKPTNNGSAVKREPVVVVMAPDLEKEKDLAMNESKQPDQQQEPKPMTSLQQDQVMLDIAAKQVKLAEAMLKDHEALTAKIDTLANTNNSASKPAHRHWVTWIAVIFWRLMAVFGFVAWLAWVSWNFGFIKVTPEIVNILTQVLVNTQ